MCIFTVLGGYLVWPPFASRSATHLLRIELIRLLIVDEWHNNGPRDLVTVSLCIQNAINKMHLCSLSIAYAWPYHNPTATMGHSIHKIEPDAIECEHLPIQSVTTMNCSQLKTPMKTTSMQMSFPETVSDSFVNKCFGYANRLLQQLSGWPVSDDLGGEDAGCGGPGLVWLHVVCGCEVGWMYCQIIWNAFGDGLL